jgi:propane monooxygenase coupling protein
MSEPPPAKRERIGVSLMTSAETEAAVAWLQDHHPDASVKFRDCYFKIERDQELEFDLAGISEYLGRELDTETFLVNLSSYYGRILMEDSVIRIVSEIASA